jgi:hypothetical protein
MSETTTPTMYARVTAYKNILVIEWLTETSDDNVVTPYDKPGNLGYVCNDTNLIGVSDEAYQILKNQIKRSSDAIGEIDAFRCDDGRYAFATLGGKYSLVDPKHAAGSRTYECPDRGSFQVIDNESPQGAREAIDAEVPDEA